MPSGIVPVTRSWIRRTAEQAASASSACPKVVTAKKVLVRARRPSMSPRKPLCSETARIAAGCRVCSSRARMPPTNMLASPCTRAIALSGSNHRGPGRPWMRSRCRGPSGPATRANTAAPSRSRVVSIRLTPRD